jgi:RNA polymerase sigma-70 factor (ECF subfamily)
MRSDYLKQRNQIGESAIQTPLAKNAAINNPERLMERAMDLDAQALSHLHDHYYPAVYRYVRYRLENEQVVEDISAEVFLRLLDHLHRRKGEIHDLRAWLIGTASHLVNDFLRHKYRRPTEAIEDHEMLAAADNLPETAEMNEEQAAVRQAMQKLTNEQQHVLALRFSQGFSVEDTAQMMNKSNGAVKVLQFRALNMLRKLLSGETFKREKTL